MKPFTLVIRTVISVGVGLLASGEVVSAQETGAPVINADGRSGTSNARRNPAVEADGPTLVYGDLNPGEGTTVIGPPEEAPVPVATDPDPAPAPSADPAGAEGMGALLAPGTTGDITATDGNAAARGPGSASAAPGTVTHDGDSDTPLLGPDGTDSIVEDTPSDVIVGDTGVFVPARNRHRRRSPKRGRPENLWLTSRSPPRPQAPVRLISMRTTMPMRSRWRSVSIRIIRTPMATASRTGMRSRAMAPTRSAGTPMVMGSRTATSCLPLGATRSPGMPPKPVSRRTRRPSLSAGPTLKGWPGSDPIGATAPTARRS